MGCRSGSDRRREGVATRTGAATAIADGHKRRPKRGPEETGQSRPHGKGDAGRDRRDRRRGHDMRKQSPGRPEATHDLRTSTQTAAQTSTDTESNPPFSSAAAKNSSSACYGIAPAARPGNFVQQTHAFAFSRQGNEAVSALHYPPSHALAHFLTASGRHPPENDPVTQAQAPDRLAGKLAGEPAADG